MQTYSIYLPPEDGGDIARVKARFMSDGKALLALIVPVVWLVWNRLWLALAVYVAYSLILLIMVQNGFQAIAGLLSAIPGIFLLLEGRRMIISKMERAGWRFQGVVIAANAADAEDRYFRGGVLDRPDVAAATSAQDTSPPNQTPRTPLIGQNPRRKPSGPLRQLGLFPE